jgi:hypothetical protein
MNTFEQYLALHEIDPIRLSMEAKVRYLIIHNAKKGNPITDENAKKIRAAVLRLTGEPYDGSFVLIPAPVTANQLPAIPVKKLPSHMRSVS